jgi:hypothetical protein
VVVTVEVPVKVVETKDVREEKAKKVVETAKIEVPIKKVEMVVEDI